MIEAQQARSWKVAAQLYNSAVAASAIAAAWELGALDELRDKGVLDAHEFAARNDLDPVSTLAMFRALAAVKIVERDGTRVTPAADFAEIQQTRSFFHWLSRGSAELFRRMPLVLRNQNRGGDLDPRDPAAVAYACREINALTYDPWFWSAVDGIDFDPTMIADLGCGSGDRLIKMLQRHPGANGIGIDIAADSLKVAESDAVGAGLADRLTFVTADVRTMDGRPEFTEVELLTCFMMGHDFWPRERCVATLARIRELFPGVRRFLLGDATRTVGTPDHELPVFTLGFEVAHDMMGTFLPTVADWESAFAESGWGLRHKHVIDMTVGEVIFELEPA
ncbi:class I SAM-dependent methyltransferase [Streptomyces sp. MB22_4]|uniref:class I SAM-dependent methyltransferase n=1 Tax=Streptomyces sp. MB22_4 TaxID=3383120 RepID=UPI0039A019EB